MALVLDEKYDLNQVSLTGVRALVLMGLLVTSPRSLEEIREKFLEYNIMDNSQSNDILRIDMNTLKSFGCEISRSSAKTGFKYVLTKHPFDIKISKDETKMLKKVFDKIKNSLDITKLIELDKFLNKLSKHIYDPETKETFLGISPLKYYNMEMVKELYAACANNYTVKLDYRKSYSKQPDRKEIVAQKLVYNNDKLYLYGFDIEKQENVTLLFNRIKAVISKSLTTNKIKSGTLKIKFLSKDFDTDFLTTEENILESNDSGYIIEGNYHNEFLAIQRILSLGSKCTVIEPLAFKNKIISKLKEMRKLYEKE